MNLAQRQVRTLFSEIYSTKLGLTRIFAFGLYSLEHCSLIIGNVFELLTQRMGKTGLIWCNECYMNCVVLKFLLILKIGLLRPRSCMWISLSLHNMIFDKWFMGHITPLAETGTTITVPYLKLCHCNTIEDRVNLIFKWRSGCRLTRSSNEDLQMSCSGLTWMRGYWNNNLRNGHQETYQF